MESNASSEPQLPVSQQTAALLPPTSQSIAPWWHTLVLIAGIALLSVAGKQEISAKNVAALASSRYSTYASTIGSEVLMLLWVYFGMRLRKVPFRSLFGDMSGGVRTFFLDIGIGGLFWIGSLTVLGAIGITWTAIDMALKHQSLFGSHGKAVTPDPAQEKLIHTLSALAPSNGREVLAWALVCVMAGLIEELVFRGYFQRQFTAWSRGAIAGGVIFSALMFGSAHGYQGARNMVLLTIFGVLFSLLAVFRRNLRAGMIAHAWHDFFVGLLLTLMKTKHLI